VEVDRGALRIVVAWIKVAWIKAACILALLPAAMIVALSPPAAAQGGPPYYTNDPGTPGNLNWEINIGYMPFLYDGQSTSHVPDVDINFGVGDRIQLTYENAWLRVQRPSSGTQSSGAEFGVGQSNPGVKWRFYDAGESGLAVSVFPQLFLNNPNAAVRRGITPASQSFLLPFEFTRKLVPSMWITKSVISLSTRDPMAGSPASSSATISRRSSKRTWNSIPRALSILPGISPPSMLALAIKFTVLSFFS
jgi:hypothetical protein